MRYETHNFDVGLSHLSTGYCHFIQLNKKDKSNVVVNDPYI